MSGPTVVVVPIPPEPSLLLMSATALMAAETMRRAVQAVQDAHTEAAALQAQHTQERQTHSEQLRTADAQHRHALQQQCVAAHQQWLTLCEVATAIGCPSPVTPPDRPPDTATSAVLATYLRAMHALTHQLAQQIDQHPTDRHDLADLDRFDSPAQTHLETVLAAYAQRQSPELLASVQRILTRVAHVPWPDTLHQLVEQLAMPLTADRAQDLLIELRRQVHALHQAEIARAQAVVLIHTLKDLGYELEDVGETLFVEGGVMHFRRPGWGDYMVRLRVHAGQQTANFNVIRAVSEGENERSVLDHLAEDRWCAEFPALLSALEARGMPMHVTLRLDAGELPVQLVSRNKLPRLIPHTEAETIHRHAPLQRRLT